MSGGRQYRLVRELGTGTFGTVYQAELQSLGDFKKDVALKVLHPMWERNEDAAGRFRDEARLLGAIRHRHIVKVDGLVRVGGRWAVVMEYVDGVDGNTVIKACRKANEPYPIPAALEVCASVASALDAAFHAKADNDTELKVIHRDVKPSNVRLTADGDVKVLDFGIAAADFSGREIVTDSIRYGSIRYMSPERKTAARDTASGDVYALGCVLFEFLLGRPFGNAETSIAEHTHKVHHDLRRIAKRCGTDAEAIVPLLERMLDFEETKRPTAAEVAEELRRLSRAVPGEDQVSFARRFVPKVAMLVGDASVPVDRTVSAESGSSAEVLLDGAANPVLKEETIAPAMTRKGGPPPKPALPFRGVTLPVVSATILVGAALIAQSTMAEESAAYVAGPRVVTVSSSGLSRPLPDLIPIEILVIPPDPVPEPAPTPVAPKVAPDPTPPPSPTTLRSTAEDVDLSQVPVLRAVKFTVSDATAVTAECLGARAEGTTSALVREPHAGVCRVSATIGGVAHQAEVPVSAEGGLTCALEGLALVCR